ncbi:hypothetical protein Bbelb_349650 [Branchiostoma belcheri]|nr:hypothetical protein Bbelb_349650 [Branchiostoma belcheri]
MQGSDITEGFSKLRALLCHPKPPHLRKWTQLDTLKQATSTIETLQKRLISRNENRSGISVPTNPTGLVNGSKPRLPPIRKTDDIVTATSLHIVSSPVVDREY